MILQRRVLLAGLLWSGCADNSAGDARTNDDSVSENHERDEDQDDDVVSDDDTEEQSPQEAEPDQDEETEEDAAPVTTDDDDEPTIRICDEGTSFCGNYNSTISCVDNAWVETTCDDGYGCVSGQCVIGRCSDTCALWETRDGVECAVVDVFGEGQLLEIDDEMLHDKARSFHKRLRRDAMTFGAVSEIRYEDPPTYEDPDYMMGTGDSAILTGQYIASEALHYKTTGSISALEKLLEGIDTMHLWWNVSGHPGMMTRYAQPQDVHDLDHLGEEVPVTDILGPRAEPTERYHRDVEYEGELYEYLGHISRDQYQGIMLAYSLAYEVLDDRYADVKTLIREDIVEFIDELITERSIPANINIYFEPIRILGQDIDHFSVEATLELRHTVVNPDEYDTDGRAYVEYHYSGPNEGDSTFYGFQEFIPNLMTLFSQVDLPSWLSWVHSTPIPRADSAIMIASFLRVGMQVTDGVPGFEDKYETYQSYFETHAGPGIPGVNEGDLWFDVALTSLGRAASGCAKGYYGHNIMMTPLYNWLRLEDDSIRQTALADVLIRGQLWPRYKKHKNSYFMYIMANAVGRDETHPDVIEATRQLTLFEPPPRPRWPTNYMDDETIERQPGCEREALHALDINVRAPEFFEWWHHPWELQDPGDLHRVPAGSAYLLAYWLGRAEGFIEEDTSHCLAYVNPDAS